MGAHGDPGQHGRRGNGTNNRELWNGRIGNLRHDHRSHHTNQSRSTAAEVTVVAGSTPRVSGRGRRGRRMRNSKKTVPASNMAAAKFTHRTRTCETGGPIRPVPAAPPAGSRSPTPKRRNPLVV